MRSMVLVRTADLVDAARRDALRAFVLGVVEELVDDRACAANAHEQAERLDLKASPPKGPLDLSSG